MAVREQWIVTEINSELLKINIEGGDLFGGVGKES